MSPSESTDAPHNAAVVDNDAARSRDSARPGRLQGALFQSIGDAGRAELVERRLAGAITGGHLRAGERLPSENDLARTFGVAPTTVRESLLALRGRGLVVTRRGRNGGSFVAESTDPVAHARTALAETSRLALRDMGAHYAAITAACVRLAARRAVPSEVQKVRSRLNRLNESDLEQWRSTLDDVQIELVALSQSARLTREQMRLQAEMSPMLRLIDADEASRSAQHALLLSVVDAVEAGDDQAAVAATERMVDAVIDALIDLQSHTR
ncbi:putative GntR-family transcriptional regulator [marine actinobacterium PHSC20C1]|nr:putative GntR-family transcriptional regulator [marine actinobacterium PHSC20C1]